MKFQHTVKRFILFLGLCIPSRLFFVYIAKNSDKKNLKFLGYLALIPALGFSMIFLFNLRKKGLETFGEKIWWNNLRPLHATLYFLFAYLAIKNNKDAWKSLLIDTVIGLNAFFVYHTAKIL